MSGGGIDPPGRTPRELLLTTAARAVLAEFRAPLKQRRLSPRATATLRLLETALDLYRDTEITAS